VPSVAVRSSAVNLFFAVLILSSVAVRANDENIDSLWHYGAYLDLNYAPDLSTPRSVPFRDKLTTNRLNQFSPDLGMVYLSKTTSTESPWGFELSGQAGYDTNGQLPLSQPLVGANVLRYFSRANVSYQTDIGNGLKFNGGLMNSFIGYESFYAKDNINYTRAWGSDYSPYFLIGVGATYPVNEKIDAGLYIVSDYNYLQEVNTQPKYASQFTYRINEHLKWMENAFVGPEQTNTAFQYWRGFLNSMLEWSQDDWTVAYVLDGGSQRTTAANHVQDLYVANAVYGRWNFSGPWTLGVRPELYYDPNGLQTGNIQFIKAISTTLEYKFSEAGFTNRVRLEYRYDNSTGTQGGFYGPQGINGPLIEGQSLIYLVVMMNYDGQFRP
jgi:Putative beta-barrel porin-2, OmpL-like. bbp2